MRRLGVLPIRGSGGGGKTKADKGGAVALREMARALGEGRSIAMTADAPKRARVCALGIVTLAQLSGRPIAPTAVVTSHRFQFDTWDRASLGKPYGKGAIVVGDLVWVARDADASRLRRRASASKRGSMTSIAALMRLSASTTLAETCARHEDACHPWAPIAPRRLWPRRSPGMWLRRVLARGKEDPERLEERFGVASRPRPKGGLIWVHGASVGEAFSLDPILQRIAAAGHACLVTTGTVTSARMIASRLPPRAMHQFAPLDAPRPMRRFFAALAPGSWADRRI